MEEQESSLSKQREMWVQARHKERRRRGESSGGRTEEASPSESKYQQRREGEEAELEKGRGERWWQKKAVRVAV